MTIWLWLITNWRIIAAALAGAVLCAPVSYCAGKRDAKIAGAAKVEAASARVREAAAKAEIAATAVDAMRRAKTSKETEELQEIIQNAPTGNDAGPATSAVLQRLRTRRGG